MSGGHFNYKQHYLNDICEELEEVINKNGIEKTLAEIKAENFFVDLDNKYEVSFYKYDYNYNKETIEEFKKAIKILKLAKTYADRIDYLLSGDDGEESFIYRLKEEIKLLD